MNNITPPTKQDQTKKLSLNKETVVNLNGPFGGGCPNCSSGGTTTSIRICCCCVSDPCA